LNVKGNPLIETTGFCHTRRRWKIFCNAEVSPKSQLIIGKRKAVLNTKTSHVHRRDYKHRKKKGEQVPDGKFFAGAKNRTNGSCTTIQKKNDKGMRQPKKKWGKKTGEL